MRPRGEYILATGVLVLAAMLRLWQLSQTPPGLHYDEAMLLLSGLKIARAEAFPLYITDALGVEPLFAYLSAVPLGIMGPVHWAGRLTSAWVGLLGVALVYRATREMFGRRGPAVLAAWVLATFYWHLDLSRFGREPIIAATAVTGAMAALWHAARTGRRWAYALSGVGLGLALDGYSAARLFPGVLLIAVAALAAQPGRRRSMLVGGALLSAGALITFAPVGWFFVQNPEWFVGRFQGVTQATLAGPDAGRKLWSNVLAAMAGLFVGGDGNWRHNLPGRAGLDAVQAVLFGVGGIACIRRWRSLEYLTLLGWLLVGLLPSALTEYPLQFTRAVMAAPAIAMLIALGARAVWHVTGRRSWVRSALGVALAVSFALAVRDYFFRWARDSNLFTAFDVPLQWMAQELREAPEGAALFETPVYRDWYTFEFTLGSEAFERFKTFDGRHCTVIPKFTAVDTAYAVTAAEDPFTLPFLESAFPMGVITDQLVRSGTSHSVVFQIPSGHVAKLEPDLLRQIDFGGVVGLRGYSVTGTHLRAGGRVDLTMVWEAEQQTPAAYKNLLALLGEPRPDGSVIYAQRDAEPCAGSYPSWRWAPGELVIDRVSLPLPTDLPPGEYRLVTAWYDSVTLERLPADDELQRARDGLAELDIFVVESG